MTGRPTDVVFVVMPFADVRRPAIGVSLLQAAAKQAGYSAATEYCNLAFADRVGRDLYRVISAGALAPDLLVGEWLFADAVFGDRIATADEYVRDVLAPHADPDLVDRIVAVRAQRESYLDACVEQIVARSPRVVGFTTTFDQTCASLAVATRLAQRPGAPLIVFGGASCEGEMGAQLLASFSCIDAVCSGEADRSFPRLLDVWLRDGSGPIAGVLTRDDARALPISIGIQDMDALPFPDFDDYFAALEASGAERDPRTHLVVETSRGCWWGAKHHCTFCGLNGTTMAFRSKSAERAFDEIGHLAQRHELARIATVDNILDMKYLDTLLPMLADSDFELELFYEVKANLRYEQLKKMRAGGIRSIQPGIESLSNEILRLMNKGTTALQNIQLMRWCEELDIAYTWILLAGFPGEPEAEYARMATLIPGLSHLRPPTTTARLRLDRFSPFHAASHEHGFRQVRPARAYGYVYPLAPEAMSRLAYYFDFDYEDGRVPETYLEPVSAAVAAWWQARRASRERRPRLDAEHHGDTIIVTDTRSIARSGRHELTGIAAQVYARCDGVTTLAALLRDPALAGHQARVRAAIETLQADRLLLHDEGRLLSLAVFRRRPQAVTAPDTEFMLDVAAA